MNNNSFKKGFIQLSMLSTIFIIQFFKFNNNF